jgi:hypothetical protein
MGLCRSQTLFARDRTMAILEQAAMSRRSRLRLRLYWLLASLPVRLVRSLSSLQPSARKIGPRALLLHAFAHQPLHRVANRSARRMKSACADAPRPGAIWFAISGALSVLQAGDSPVRKMHTRDQQTKRGFFWR